MSRPGWKAWNCGRDGNLSPAPGSSFVQILTSSRDLREDVQLLAPLRDDAPQRSFPACQIWAAGGAFACRPNQGPSSRSGGGEWDKTSEVPAVHGALHWWAHSKAVKPHFSKRYWRVPARFEPPAASTPAPRSATPARKPAIIR